MDDYDAKNHLRDLHREAEERRLAQLARAGRRPKSRRRSLLASSLQLLTLKLMR
ncbi:MAG TPA: hypothetical protein VHO69_02905 [Phototrophicaceae bacterium]|nr:hypothetical protein [Phototrophicaceae bacterium]